MDLDGAKKAIILSITTHIGAGSFAPHHSPLISAGGLKSDDNLRIAFSGAYADRRQYRRTVSRLTFLRWLDTYGPDRIMVLGADARGGKSHRRGIGFDIRP